MSINIMDAAIRDIFGLGSCLFLSGLVAAGLFFVMAALREMQSGTVNALLFMVLAAFFGCVHFIIIYANCDVPGLGIFRTNYTVEGWFIEILGPAVALLLLLIGFFNFLQQRFSEAVFKILIGLGVWALLHDAGQACPDMAKMSLFVLAAMTWIGLELRATPEM